MRYVVISYTLKDNKGTEHSSLKGYALRTDEALPPYNDIRQSCINSSGGGVSYFKINSITFLNEQDYKSFMMIEEK